MSGGDHTHLLVKVKVQKTGIRHHYYIVIPADTSPLICELVARGVARTKHGRAKATIDWQMHYEGSGELIDSVQCVSYEQGEQPKLHTLCHNTARHSDG